MEPKGGDNVKKFLAGILFGSILVFSITGYADSLIGKQIDATFPLLINNEQSPKDVVSIEGTSYLPVRSAGEMFGYDVNFINNQVILTEQITKEVAIETINVVENIEINEEVQGGGAVIAFNIKSNEFDVWERWEGQLNIYSIRDNITYVPFQIFHNYSTYENGVTTLKLPNGVTYSVVATGQETYAKGCEFFVEKSRTYIDISLFNYTVREDGNTLWIEAQ